MSGVVLALVASIGWGFSDFLGGSKTRTVALPVVLVVSQLTGLIGIAVLLAVRGEPIPPDGRLFAAVLAGVAASAELGLLYYAMAKGPIVIVAPIASAGAVLPVVVGGIRGDPMSGTAIAGIVCALVGGLGAAWEPIDLRAGSGGFGPGAAVAALAAVAIGLFFVLLGAASAADPYWATGVMRVSSSAVAVGLWFATQQHRPGAGKLPTSTVLTLAAVGLSDVIADAAFAKASTTGALSIVATLGSLYPVVTVLLAATVLRERVSRLQAVGVGLALTGVLLLGAVETA